MNKHELGYLGDNPILYLKEFDFSVNEEYMESLLESLPGNFEEEARLILDFKEIHYLDSAMIGAYIHVLKKMLKNRKHIYCVNLSRKIQKIFELIKLHDYFVIIPEEKNAEFFKAMRKHQCQDCMFKSN